MKFLKPLLIALVLLSFVVAPITAAPEEYEIYVDTNGESMIWATNFDNGLAELTVSGTRKFARAITTEDGEKPKFSAYDDRGKFLPDGQYRWNVVFTSPIDRELSEAIKEARIKNDEQFVCDLIDEGIIASVDFSGYFLILDGKIMLPGDEEEPKSAPVPEKVASTVDESDRSGALKDFVINDDLIVDGSACIGFDCVNGESFSFDTIRLKENNLRIKFDDTSTAASFPRTDWQLTANDSANGGASKFSIDDISGGRTPFTVEANAPSHSLYVDDGGRIGLGTSTPVAELHAVDGDTPTLRLEQNGSSGFAPQTWDVAGNETNFFIRDASNGSTLPFRIRPGADTSSIFINEDSDVGIGTASPDHRLHIVKNEANAGTALLDLDNTNAAGAELIRMTHDDCNDAADNCWTVGRANSGNFIISRVLSGANEVQITPGGTLAFTGDITAQGDFISGGTTLNVPDYVFEPDYELMPLDELQSFIEANRHLPKVPSANNVKDEGLNMSQLQMRLLEKVEELTLYTLDQQELIEGLQERISELEGGDAE